MHARRLLAALLLALPASANAQERYIPLELILGAQWDGQQQIAYPQGAFAEFVATTPSTWTGPRPWQHPKTGETLTVYDRSRASQRSKVDQVFAIRRDASAIGRVADSRYGIDACDREGKYPLGLWRQGESRTFDYRCWYGNADRARRATIEIPKIDYDCGQAHCLEIRWTYSDPVDGRQLDRREYVFAPERGLVALR